MILWLAKPSFTFLHLCFPLPAFTLSLYHLSFYLSISLSFSSWIECKECKHETYETWDSQWCLRADAQTQTATPPATPLPLQPPSALEQSIQGARCLAMAAHWQWHSSQQRRHHPPSYPGSAAIAMYSDYLKSFRYKWLQLSLACRKKKKTHTNSYWSTRQAALGAGNTASSLLKREHTSQQT